MSAGFKSMLGIWLGGISVPFVSVSHNAILNIDWSKSSKKKPPHNFLQWSSSKTVAKWNPNKAITTIKIEEE